MFNHYRTQGFILKKTDQGESDRIFTIFTKDFGRLKLLAKAERKIKSKLRAGLELFYLSEIEFIQGKTYKTITDAFLIEKFQNLRRNLERLTIIYKVANDLDNFVKGEEPDEKIWHLLNETFEKLNNSSLKIENWRAKRSASSSRSLLSAEAPKLKIIYYCFFWNFISILGYKPELYFCSSCQKKLKPEKLYFRAKEGGIICPNCSKNFKDKIEIKPEVVKILRKILEKDWKILLRLKLFEEYLKSLETIYKNYSSTFGFSTVAEGCTSVIAAFSISILDPSTIFKMIVCS